MFVIIVGGGKVGTYLARGLLAQKHEVVIIEKQPRKAQQMATLLDSEVTMVGDGCDPVVLEAGGLGRADVVVADTGDDEDNLVVCLIAKKQSRARCIARVNNPKNKLIFESIDHSSPIQLISSTEMILDAINQQVNSDELSLIGRLHDSDLELVKLSVAAGSPAEDKRIVDIGLPRSSIVVAVDRKGEELTIPISDTVVRAGDNVILMVKSDAREAARTALAGVRTRR